MSDNKLAKLDYYTLLGVKRDADALAIRKAFRAFAIKYHPDRYVTQAQEKRDKATEIYRRGSEAVKCLTDLEKRRAYDEGLARGIVRLTSDARVRVRSNPPPARGGAPVAAARPQAQTITSPGAKAYYAKASDLIKRGDIEGAYHALVSARDQEPGNMLIESALEKVSEKLRSMYG